jgi:hypothetical protein
VRERVVERAGADVESVVKLVGGELAAGIEELCGGPAVVGQEDLEGVALWDEMMIRATRALRKVMRAEPMQDRQDRQN